ncbi:hypothetical protein, partial [Streptomyces sp. NPDC006307]|uniref:hypothetical protein n=1 Tax=Streptomyces sp. NPDC006307 TaxID=3156748 RepID=UPI0033B0E46B
MINLAGSIRLEWWPVGDRARLLEASPGGGVGGDLDQEVLVAREHPEAILGPRNRHPTPVAPPDPVTAKAEKHGPYNHGCT